MPAPIDDPARALATLESIAREAGQILLEGWDRRDFRPAVEFKSGHNDIVTEFDRRAEDAIVARLRAEFPGAGIVGEEGSRTADASPDGVFYVDPLDGTVNFAHGMPFFAVSIGLQRAGRPALGVVHAPALDWTFTGAPDLGAFRNGRAIVPSSVPRLERALLVTGFPTALVHRTGNTPAFVAFNAVVQGLRRLGSAALDLCLVACGWLDGTWQANLQPWDTVGGAAILTGAGARVTSFTGAPFDPLAGDVVATNGLIHDEILAVLAGVQA